jgi:hypothetical protein
MPSCPATRQSRKLEVAFPQGVFWFRDPIATYILENAMKQFIARFEDQIQGTLSGFDRVVFRGSLWRLTYPEGMKMYLIQNGILCKQYQDHVKQVSQQIKEASLEPFRRLPLPIQHVYDPRQAKDEIARSLASKHGIREGNVCALTAAQSSGSNRLAGYF